MAAVNIRQRLEADIPAAADLLVRVHEHDGYPVEGVENPRAWLTSHAQRVAFVAIFDDQIVGHVSISEPSSSDDAVALWEAHPGRNDTPVATLGRLFVDPKVRGNQTGERLVRAAMQHASRQKVRLVLDVMTKDHAAIRLYERLGWECIGEAEHHVATDRSIPALCFVSPPGTEA